MSKGPEELKEEVNKLQRMYPAEQRIQQLQNRINELVTEMDANKNQVANDIENVNQEISQKEQQNKQAELTSLRNQLTTLQKKSEDLNLQGENLLDELWKDFVALADEMLPKILGEDTFSKLKSVFSGNASAESPTGEKAFSQLAKKNWPVSDERHQEFLDAGFTQKDDNTYEYKNDDDYIVGTSRGIYSKGDTLSEDGADKFVEAMESQFKDRTDQIVVTAKNEDLLNMLKERCENSDVLSNKNIKFVDQSKGKEKEEKAAKPKMSEEESQTPSPSPSPRA